MDYELALKLQNAEQFRKEFDELGLKAPKNSMKNLEREIIIDFWFKKIDLAVKQERERIFKQLNTALNKHSKTIAEGGLDYVKAFKEVEKVEEELLTLINNN